MRPRPDGYTELAIRQCAQTANGIRCESLVMIYDVGVKSGGHARRIYADHASPLWMAALTKWAPSGHQREKFDRGGGKSDLTR